MGLRDATYYPPTRVTRSVDKLLVKLFMVIAMHNYIRLYQFCYLKLACCKPLMSSGL